MVDFTYQLMLVTAMPTRGQAISPLFETPPGTDPNEWNAFLNAIRSAPARLKTRPSDLNKLKSPKTKTCSQTIYNDKDLPDRWWDKTAGELNYPVAIDFEDSGDCGAGVDWTPGGIFEPSPTFDRHGLDHTGALLGFWTASVDRQMNDTHLWFRPTNAGALGAAKKFVDDLADKALGALLLPIVCGLNCLFDDCDGCDDDAKDIADAANVLDDTSGWLPGIPGLDVSGADWVGLWHHINMTPRATNQYDDRQGEFFEEAGPDFPPDAVDLVLMAAFDASGLSVNYEKSRGVANYQIASADDGHAATKIRNQSQWQFTTIAHTPFAPVDNLGYYGWRIFRDQPDHPISSLGLPLHAIGDATVPMHVTATSAWGHRPFEDAQERLWARIRQLEAPPAEQERLLRDVLLRGFEWWKFVRNWRVANPSRATDTPVRQMTTELAKRTYDYSMLTYQQTGQRWPFNRGLSTLYLTNQDDAINQYKNFANAADLARPLFVDGMGASLALLVSASEILPAD